MSGWELLFLSGFFACLYVVLSEFVWEGLGHGD